MKGLKGMRKPCLRALTIMLVVIVALMSAAQPLLAKQATNNAEVNAVILSSPAGGIDATYRYWWGWWVYLSDATCVEVLRALSAGASVLGALSPVLGPAAPLTIIAAVILVIGAAAIIAANKNHTGIKIRIHFIPPLPPVPTYIGPQ